MLGFTAFENILPVAAMTRIAEERGFVGMRRRLRAATF